MKKNIKDENYLEKKPICKVGLNWSKDENGNVTLEMENKGIANRIMQKLIKKPKVSYIHLDEMGSFIWPLMDGERDILEIGKFVDKAWEKKMQTLNNSIKKFTR